MLYSSDKDNFIWYDSKCNSVMLFDLLIFCRYFWILYFAYTWSNALNQSIYLENMLSHIHTWNTCIHICRAFGAFWCGWHADKWSYRRLLLLWDIRPKADHAGAALDAFPDNLDHSTRFASMCVFEPSPTCVYLYMYVISHTCLMESLSGFCHD